MSASFLLRFFSFVVVLSRPPVKLQPPTDSLDSTHSLGVHSTRTRIQDRYTTHSPYPYPVWHTFLYRVNSSHLILLLSSPLLLVMSSSALVDCAVCNKSVPNSGLSAHIASTIHITNLTQRYYTLAKEHAQQTNMINTLRGVLAKADQTIDHLIKEKNDTHPIGRSSARGTNDDSI